MSKKQREKVEDEVRFHRAAQMRAASETAPDSSVFEQQTPSSSDQHHSFNGGSVSLLRIIFQHFSARKITIFYSSRELRTRIFLVKTMDHKKIQGKIKVSVLIYK